eukprot:SAG31_NODE_36862_length_309_cov_1.238095_1_plen_37_part_01
MDHSTRWRMAVQFNDTGDPSSAHIVYKKSCKTAKQLL